MDHKGFPGVIRLQASRDEALVQTPCRRDAWPSLCGQHHPFQGDLEIALNLFDRVLVADFRIGQRPKDGVDSHEE